MDLDVRVVPQEAFDVGRQVVQAEGIDGSHANLAGDDVLDLLHSVLEGGVGLEHFFAVAIKDFAFSGEPEVLLAALDEE